jgi:F-type H+-transporting ATPase subunit gamma
MANKKEIKRRIKSIKNIGQVTKALQMVSAVKMRKAQAALVGADPYFKMMQDMFSDIVADLGKEEVQEILQRRKRNDAHETHVALILVSPSRGFAGPLISNLTKKTLEFIDKRSKNTPFTQDEFLMFQESNAAPHNDEEVEINLITVEKKGKDFAMHLNRKIIADFPHLPSPVTFEEIAPIAHIGVDSFLDGSIDEVYVVYTHFVNTFTQKAVVKQVLPFSTPEVEKRKEPWFSYSEDEQILFNEFYPTFVETLLFHAVLDAIAAEQSARMIAMKNATDNASDLRKELTLEYNQKRQASITQEIAEITSAADTL